MFWTVYTQVVSSKNTHQTTPAFFVCDQARTPNITSWFVSGIIDVTAYYEPARASRGKPKNGADFLPKPLSNFRSSRREVIGKYGYIYLRSGAWVLGPPSSPSPFAPATDTKFIPTNLVCLFVCSGSEING